MSEEVANFKHEVGPVKQYSTKYTWSLNNWSMLYDSIYKNGIHSSKFDLNGIDGYTCSLRLSPITGNSGYSCPATPLTLEFSDIEEIEAMTLNVSVDNIWLQNIQRNSKPNGKQYQLQATLSKNLSNPTVATNPNNALVIVCHITIVKKSDIISLLNPTVVSPQIPVTSNPPPNILANFKTMFDRKAFCDITLVLGEEKLYAHKAVLAAQSKVFEAMFLSGMKEQSDNTIEISNFDAKLFEQFLNYLYGGEVIKMEEIVEEMLEIADFYNVSDLKIKCESIMLKSLSKTSAVRYVILADKFNCDTLKTAALRVIRQSSTIIETALLEEDAATMTELKEILSKNQPAI